MINVDATSCNLTMKGWNREESEVETENGNRMPE